MQVRCKLSLGRAELQDMVNRLFSPFERPCEVCGIHIAFADRRDGMACSLFPTTTKVVELGDGSKVAFVESDVREVAPLGPHHRTAMLEHGHHILYDLVLGVQYTISC